jgi:hypothetical protein
MATKKKTYAEEAKSIMNKYKLRLGENFDKNDKLAEKAMEAELSSLRERQEADRASLFPEETGQFANGGVLPKYDGFNFSQFLNRPTPNFNVAPDTLPATPALAMAAQTGSAPVVDNTQVPFQSRVPIGGFIEGAAGLISNWGDLDLPTYEPTEFKPDQIAPKLVDYRRGREQTMRERDLANAMISRGAAQSGSQSALMERLMAGRTATQRTAGTAFNQSIEAQANENARIRNQAAARNAELNLSAAQMNERNKLYANQLERENALINEQRRGNRIASVTNALSGYLKDRNLASNYDQMINMELARNPNYGLVQDDPTWLRRLLGFTDPITEVSFRNTNDKVTG